MTKELIHPWPFPDMKNPPSSFLWRSRFAVSFVGTWSKIFLCWCNNLRLHNEEPLHKLVSKRPNGRPLITACNHYSCIDDPGIWGMLKFEHLWDSKKMRWSPAAHDIAFTRKFYNWFFSSGKSIPIIRGKGVYQKAMNFCVERLNEGQWVHIFPEGKVNMSLEKMRLKWGIGRLVYDCSLDPIVLLFYHIGMEKVLPNTRPYIPQINKNITVVVGEPLDFGELVKEMRDRNEDPATARKLITDIIQEELYKLREKAEHLHFNTS